MTSILQELNSQSQEIAKIVEAEIERLRAVLSNQHSRQMEEMVRAITDQAVALLRQKEEEIARINRRLLQLEVQASSSRRERDASRKIAEENKEVVKTLRRTLQQSTGGEIGGGSRSSSAHPHACRVCNERKAIMVLMPCRHMCCCQACASSLAVCPSCGFEKINSVEAIMD